MDYKDLRKKIKTFSLDDGHLGSQGYERVLLQVFGLTGHGKSAFINSCMYVLNDGGHFRNYAGAGNTYETRTMIRKAYELTSNITIVDNRGCVKVTDFERAEVYAQLGNFHPLNQRVEWKENFNEAVSALEDSDLDKNTSDFLVPIFVFSSEWKAHPNEEKSVKVFLKNCDKMTGVVPIIVLTKKVGGDFLEAEKTFKRMGAETVFAIENYTEESNVETLERSADILMIIQKALENVAFRLSIPRDAKKERIERKIFLLNYIHTAVTEYEKMKTMTESPNQELVENKKMNAPRGTPWEWYPFISLQYVLIKMVLFIFDQKRK